jgi:predicted neutral ceramidase superfamily lipid hydrolase
MQHWSDKLSLLIITLWVGALWAIGYLAAPVLFYALDDKQLAGMLAGKMFTLVAYVGIASGFYLLIQRLARVGTTALKQSFFWAVFFMLVLALIGHFGIQPIIAQLKAQALPADVMNSVFASRFKTWHGVASIAYLVQSLLGVVLILKANR